MHVLGELPAMSWVSCPVYYGCVAHYFVCAALYVLNVLPTMNGMCCVGCVAQCAWDACPGGAAHYASLGCLLSVGQSRHRATIATTSRLAS